MPLRIYDNTEVSGHRHCNRRHFFRHELHLTYPGTAPALAFGLAWHSAMDVVWSEIGELHKDQKHEEIIEFLRERVYPAWEAVWIEEGFPSASDMNDELRDKLKARTPDTAIEMLLSYIMERWDTLRYDFKFLSKEQPFVVPLDPSDPTLWYSGRLDKVFEYQGGIWLCDHKSSSLYAKQGGFQRSFLDSFSPDSQISGYCYGAKLLYGDRFKGAYIDAALVSKTHHDIFTLVPVKRMQDQLDAWLWETREEIRRIEVDHEVIGADWWPDPQDDGGTAELKVFSPTVASLTHLPGAPKNTGNCFNFNTPCPYLDLCQSWGNPLKGLVEHGLPQGYVIDEWSPFTEEQLATIEKMMKEVGG